VKEVRFQWLIGGFEDGRFIGSDYKEICAQPTPQEIKMAMKTGSSNIY
jgi:hypothetical protein